MNKRMHCFLTRLLGLIIGVEVVSLPFVYMATSYVPSSIDYSTWQNTPINTPVWSGGFGFTPIILPLIIIGLIICLYYWFKPCLIRNNHDKPD